MAVPYAVLILEQKINTFPCCILQIILGDKPWEISRRLSLVNSVVSSTGTMLAVCGGSALGALHHWLPFQLSFSVLI